MMSDTGQDSEQKSSIIPWNSLERWTPTAFLIAGALLLVFTALTGVEAFTDTTPPRWMGAVFVVPGLVAGHIGLLGFYPKLSQEVPRQAMANSFVVLVAMIAALGLFVTEIGSAVIGEELPIAGLFYLVMVLMTTVGYLLVSTASFRAGIPSRTVAFLLLLPPAEFMLMMAGIATGFTPAWSSFLLSGLQVVAHLAIGFTLQTEVGRSHRTEPSADTIEG